MTQLIDPGYLAKVFPLLITYLPKTISISMISMIFAFLIALPVVIFQIKKIPVLSQIAEIYVLITRACPLMVQIYVIYFGVPILLLYAKTRGLEFDMSSIDATVLGTIAMSLHFGAYISQVLRAALLAVDKGQMEAALAVGMSWRQGFQRIVLPQAMCYALPPLSSQFLNIVKSTSILFTISVQELMSGAMILGAQSYRYLELYILVAAIYWVICFVIEKIIDAISLRASVFVKG